MSHDSVNRFLLRENFGPKDLFLEAVTKLILEGGTLSVDDTVLDKPYSHYTALVGHYYSGKHHKAVKGINLITLYYTDIKGYSLPVNFRIYNPADGKTKNDYFIDITAYALNKDYDAGKNVSEIKRYIVVDTKDLPHTITITTTNVTDRAGALEVFKDNKATLSKVESVLVDGSYTGQSFGNAANKILQATVQVTKRNELHTFKVIPQRWVVEHSFSWL